MAKWTCEQCGGEFTRDKSGARPIRFCGQACYHAWRAEAEITTGQFKNGHKPWNAGMKGLHLSPDTEWRPGCNSHKILPIGSVRVRTRKRDGKPRAFVKIGNPNVWRERALVVWEKHYGSIPDGMVVHHIDRDTKNDAIENLQAMSRADHIREHRAELLGARL